MGLGRHGGWAEVHGGVEERRGKYRYTSPRKLRQFYETTPIDLVDEPKEPLYGRETDRDLRNA